jgi:hypothetical protein
VTGSQPVEYLTVADVEAELNVSVNQVRTLIHPERTASRLSECAPRSQRASVV